MTASICWSDWSCAVRRSVADERILAKAHQRVIGLMSDVAAAVSRFDPASDLSWVNARAGSLTPVSRRCIELIGVALDAARTTDGACDPTVGAHLVAAGYDRDIELVRSGDSDAEIPTDRTPECSPDWRTVAVNADLDLVGVPRGLVLDLGATAKAWTVDEAARQISAEFDAATLIEIGGDLAAAGPPSPPWRILVAERTGDPGQLVSLSHGGLTTSTTTIRRWRRDGCSDHHVIDPRTGRPSTGRWRTASVWAPTAAVANAASIAALVLGDDGPQFLQQRRLPARLVGVDGTVYRVGDWLAEEEVAS